ncbi:MAG: adenylosuccinate synthase [Pseudomonadota bacterium]
MNNVIVIGTQWGDEGKGKIVDWLADQADVIVRFQGGHNAGHTLVINDQVYKLSLLPSGIIRKNKISIIGSGVVIDPYALLNEISQIQQNNIEISPDNLAIAENANLILPFHSDNDHFSEIKRGSDKIGTTGRGIGPAYEDKVARRGIRICDLAEADILKSRLFNLIEYHNLIRQSFNAQLIDPQEIYDDLLKIADKILPYAQPVWRLIDQQQKLNKKILYEGAQGAMLDIDYGTYPYVTSSSTIAGQAFVGSGKGICQKSNILGITKAYTTRVGSGPFPTEQNNDIGEFLGKKGHEIGTVTGRNRRCGWFDAVLVRQAIKLSGITDIVLTKLDVLDDLAELKICVGYEYDDKKYDYLPASINIQKNLTPIYETLEGWQSQTYKANSYEDLPEKAIKYIKRIEELIEVPITIISTGPERNETIMLNSPF